MLLAHNGDSEFRASFGIGCESKAFAGFGGISPVEHKEILLRTNPNKYSLEELTEKCLLLELPKVCHFIVR